MLVFCAVNTVCKEAALVSLGPLRLGALGVMAMGSLFNRALALAWEASCYLEYLRLCSSLSSAKAVPSISESNCNCSEVVSFFSEASLIELVFPVSCHSYN